MLPGESVAVVLPRRTEYESQDSRRLTEKKLSLNSKSKIDFLWLSLVMYSC